MTKRTGLGGFESETGQNVIKVMTKIGSLEGNKCESGWKLTCQIQQLGEAEYIFIRIDF